MPLNLTLETLTVLVKHFHFSRFHFFWFVIRVHLGRSCSPSYSLRLPCISVTPRKNISYTVAALSFEAVKAKGFHCAFGFPRFHFSLLQPWRNSLKQVKS